MAGLQTDLLPLFMIASIRPEAHYSMTSESKKQTKPVESIEDQTIGKEMPTDCKHAQEARLKSWFNDMSSHRVLHLIVAQSQTDGQCEDDSE